MPVSAITLAKLLNAGLSGQDLLDVVASIDADMATVDRRAALNVTDERVERRRAKDRERKRMRNSTEFRGNSAGVPQDSDAPDQCANGETSGRNVGAAEGELLSPSRMRLLNVDKPESVSVRNSAESCGNTTAKMDSGGLSSPQGFPPTPPFPKPHQSIPPSPPKGGSSPAANITAEFDQRFWPVYPNRVGKPAALKAFGKARKRAELDVILAGLRRYVDKTDDRPWCNPATWLNQDRWDDQPMAVQRAPPRRSAFREHQDEVKKHLERQANGRTRDDRQRSAFDLDLEAEAYRRE